MRHIIIRILQLGHLPVSLIGFACRASSLRGAAARVSYKHEPDKEAAQAREAAEASARDIAVRVAALEAAAVMRDTEEAALRSSRDGLAIELEEGMKKLDDLTMQLEELKEENAALKQEVTESSDEAGGGTAEQGERDYDETGARASAGFEDGFGRLRVPCT